MPASPNQPLEIGIWYPADEAVSPIPNTPFGQALALDAEPVGRDRPLIIISHGNSGWMGGHAGTALALAEAGYVVAALTHADDNYENESVSPSVWAVSRPDEVVASIAYMLERWPGADHISRERIGVFGFSAGGYTALVTAGGAPDFQQAMQHCEDEPIEFTCEIGLIEDIASTDVKFTSRDPASEPQVKAISIAAPGFGFAFDGKSLEAISIPVQIWSGSLDSRVPHDSNGRLLADALNSETDVEFVEGAGHFSFLQPCDPKLESENPRIWNMICVDEGDFDRVAFHEEFNAKVVKFFDKALTQ